MHPFKYMSIDKYWMKETILSTGQKRQRALQQKRKPI